jgi:TM2 domain-containing membrane protein YozV
LFIHPSQAGSVISCPKCSGKFQVPLPTASAGYAGSGRIGLHQDDVQSFASRKIASGLLGIFLGGLGIHKFILGFPTAGTIMLVVWLAGITTGMCLVVPLFASAAMAIIGFVEGIIYLTKSDEDFYRTYAVEKREWF